MLLLLAIEYENKFSKSLFLNKMKTRPNQLFSYRFQDNLYYIVNQIL